MKCVSGCLFVTDAHCTFIRHLLRFVGVCVRPPLSVCMVDMRVSGCAHTNLASYIQRRIHTLSHTYTHRPGVHGSHTSDRCVCFGTGIRCRYNMPHVTGVYRLHGIVHETHECFMRLYFSRLVACVPPIHFFLSLSRSLRRSQYLQREHCSPLHTMFDVVAVLRFSSPIHTGTRSEYRLVCAECNFLLIVGCIGSCVDFQAHRQWPSGANLLPARFNTKHCTHSKKMSSR